MDYKRIYNEIINSRRNNPPEGYGENHHVIPSSFGGSDDASNIVRLTAREHFLCHWLLVRMYPTGRLSYKAIKAFGSMVWRHSENQERHRCTARVYERLKKQYSDMMTKSQKGDSNSQHGTMWITDGIQAKKIKKSVDIIPEGWYNGRTIRKCVICSEPVKNKNGSYCQEHRYHKKKTDTEQRYLTILREATSISDAIKKLGLQPKGGTYKRMKEVIVKHDLSDKFRSEKIIWE